MGSMGVDDMFYSYACQVLAGQTHAIVSEEEDISIRDHKAIVGLGSARAILG